jgi:hypothetical protein
VGRVVAEVVVGTTALTLGKLGDGVPERRSVARARSPGVARVLGCEPGALEGRLERGRRPLAAGVGKA